MTESTLKKLVGALVIAVALWGVTSLFGGGGAGTIGASGDIAEFFEGVDESTLTAVRLPGMDEPVELTREGDAWLANGYRTDSATVARFMTLLSGVEVGDLMATNPDNHERMGVSESMAKAMEIDVDGSTRTLWVGHVGRRFGTVYARLPGEDGVYLLEGDLSTHLRRRIEDWRDKRMAAVDTSLVVRVEVERDGDAYALVRGDSVWAFEDGSEAAAGSVRSLLGDLANLLASGFYAEDDSVAMLEQGGSTVAYGTEGEVLAEILIGSGETDRWGRVAGEDVIYRLPSFRVSNIAPPLEDVRPDS